MAVQSRCGFCSTLIIIIWHLRPSENGVNEALPVLKSNNGELGQIKEQKRDWGENQDWLSKLANLEVLPPPVRALGRMEKMRTSVVIDDCIVIKL